MRTQKAPPDRSLLAPDALELLTVGGEGLEGLLLGHLRELAHLDGRLGGADGAEVSREDVSGEVREARLAQAPDGAHGLAAGVASPTSTSVQPRASWLSRTAAVTLRRELMRSA
eukprot:6589264-Alexandrium_andersonii.AAC.1